MIMMERFFPKPFYPIAFILVLLPVLRIIKFAPEIPIFVYYGSIAIIGLYVFLKGGMQNIYKLPGFFLLFCALSLLFNNVDPNYRAWDRLFGLFAIIMTVGPMFDNQYSIKFKRVCLKYLMLASILISVCSFALYLIAPGLTYTLRGNLYGGITVHSMTLSPLAALGAMYSVQYLIINLENLSKRDVTIGLGVTIVCLINCVLSGSRAALLSFVIAMILWLWLYLRDDKKRFVRYALVIVGITVATAPVWWKYTETIQMKMRYAEEQGSMLSSRQGRWDARLIEFEHNPVFGCGFATIEGVASEKGTVEPGNGWLFVLSSCGALAFVVFVITYVKAGVLANSANNEDGLFALSLLVFFAVHLNAEGYSISSGNIFCFIMWLTIGCAYTLQYKEE